MWFTEPTKQESQGLAESEAVCMRPACSVPGPQPVCYGCQLGVTL